MDTCFSQDSVEVVDAREDMFLDTAAKRKRRRLTAPLEVTRVRRSVRATRYKGFKAPSMSGIKRKESHVKPRKIPEMYVTTVEHEMEVQYSQSAPPPTPIKTLQHLGINICGVPPEELSEDNLMQGEEEQNLGQV